MGNDITIPTEVEADVQCECGADLDSVVKVNNAYTVIIVDACQICIDKAYKDGVNDGHDDGYSEGFEAGKAESV